MPVPAPAPEDVLRRPPDGPEARAAALGMAALVAPDDGLTRLQSLLLRATFSELTGFEVDIDDPPATTPEQFALLQARRSLEDRERMLQIMLLGALVLRPLPRDVADRLKAVAREMSLNDGMVKVAEDLAHQSYALAAKDFDRNGYAETWHPDDAAQLHTSRQLQSAWDEDFDDPDLAARWNAMGQLPQGTLGRSTWEMYRARGWEFPGSPGSAPPLLAQHDFVHVLADFGTVVESELEVFAFIARANDDLHAFSLLAMVVSLFETGSLRAGAGLFEASPGHLSSHESTAVRVANAMRRGMQCRDVAANTPDVDFLRVDWLGLAHEPLEDLRERFNVTEKSIAALAAGSVGPWEPGGISAFQLNAGQERAKAQGYEYDAHGASVLPD